MDLAVVISSSFGSFLAGAFSVLLIVVVLVVGLMAWFGRRKETPYRAMFETHDSAEEIYRRKKSALPR